MKTYEEWRDWIERRQYDNPLVPPQLAQVMLPDWTADRAAAVELVRESRDAAYRLEREISSRFGHDDDMIPQTREPIEGMRAAVVRADAFLRGKRSSGAEGARRYSLEEVRQGKMLAFMLGAEWNAMQEGTAGRLQFYAEVAAEALRRYPDVPPAPKVGEEGR